MKRIGTAIFDIINNHLENGGVELESWRVDEITHKITAYLNEEHGLVDDKEGSRNIWGEIVRYDD